MVMVRYGVKWVGVSGKVWFGFAPCLLLLLSTRKPSSHHFRAQRLGQSDNRPNRSWRAVVLELHRDTCFSFDVKVV